MPYNPIQIVLLTCVHFRDAVAVARFAAHVSALPTPEGLQVFMAIADNSGDWPPETALPANARVYASGANLGYLRGCAYAMDRWVEEEGGLPDWTGIVNTDITLDNEFFTALFGRPLPANVGILAPHVELPDGTAQNPFMRKRPKRLRVYAYTLIYRSLALTAALHGLHRAKHAWKRRNPPLLEMPRIRTVPMDAHEEIYAPHGSAIFLCKSFFAKGGSLAYPGFLYGEELFIAEQARRLGVQVAWVPRARIHHAAHTTTGGIARQRRLRWMRESADLAWRNDFSRK